jgi:hypothetical protein
VTLNDAWPELGLEPGADAETVRRAYLRLIKTRKPEQDPEGFQRAREAYEIARAGSEFEALAAASARHHPPPRRPASADAPATAEPAEPETSEAPDQADIIFEGFSNAWASVPPSADQRQRLEIAREAVAVLPRDPRAHWLLATTLSRLGPDTALAEALRAGWQAGWPEFLEALLVRLPGKATREEVDAAFASDQPTLRLAAAAVAAAWDSPRAAALVVEMCKAATAAIDDAAGDRVRELPIVRMLDVVLALHAAGALDAAEQAQAAIRTCLSDTGLELALVQGPLGGVWTLTEEIGALPPDLPQPLRTAFAMATRSGDLRSAFGDTCAIIDRDAALVRRWAARLGPSSQNVAGIMRSALAHRAAYNSNVRRFRLSHVSFLIVPFLITVARQCTEHDYSSSYRPPIVTTSDQAYVPTPTLYAPPQPIGPGSPLAVSLQMVSDAADDLCGPGGPRHGQLACADVERLVESLRTRACDDVPSEIGQVKLKLHAGRKREEKDDLVDRFFTRVTMARWQICGKSAPVEAEGDRP